jgi:L-threonylcarbamoyladenylate synthase
LILHVATVPQAQELTIWNDSAEKLAATFWPGPLTMVLPKQQCVPDIATSGLPSVAVRMPAHPVFRDLLKEVDRPLAAPSANPFGYVSPTTARHVVEGLEGKIHAVLDGGACEVGLESTIVDLRIPVSPVVLRPGAIGLGDIQSTLQQSVSHFTKSLNTNLSAVAPGLLSKHYSPRTPLRLVDALPPRIKNMRVARVSVFGDSFPDAASPGDFILAPKEDWSTAAQNLFGLLRQLDCGDYEMIYFERLKSDQPLAIAIADRLRRAAAKFEE